MNTIDDTIRTLELADHQAHFAGVHSGRWLLPVLQACTAAAVLVARRVDRANG